MKNRYTIFGCLIACMGVMVAMFGCTDELEGIRNNTRPSDVICFTASLSDSRTSSMSRSSSGHLEMEQEEWLVGIGAEQGVSRGNPVTLLKDSAGVIGYVYAEWNNSVQPRTDLYNKKFNFDGDELTADSANVRWNELNNDKTKTKARFYVYAPYNLSEGTLSAQTQKGAPTLAYTVNDTPSNQHDLIVASWEGPANYKQSIPLTFGHALTGVKFKVGFACTVTKLEVKGIAKSGTYTFGDGWAVNEELKDYSFTFGSDDAAGQAFEANAALTDGENTLMMIPQAFSGEDAVAEVVLTYIENEEPKTITSSLAGKVWQEGKMITYTIHKTTAPTTIYFDLAAGNVLIGCTEASDATPTETNTYTGYVFENGIKTPVSGTHNESNIYYVYQTKGNNTGTSSLPNYSSITYNGKSWVDFITNNTSVAGVITAWKSAAQAVGRTATNNRIRVYGSNKVVNLTIDNIYSTYAERNMSRTKAGIGFNAGSNSKLTIKTLGDNRVSAIHYHGGTDKNNKLIFEGVGSLTVGAASGSTTFYNDSYVGETAKGDTTFIDNHWCSAIGGNDSGEGNSCGIIINSGNIFAGTTKAENCTALGAGGNDKAIITINGGTITAVATTTGTAIGGGIGFNSKGGFGDVTINGGNVYAYNHKNRWSIPSSAIGGAGSSAAGGNEGNVKINGGYVYAYSAYGTAIGGGSSATNVGGDANVTITGGQIIAKSDDGAGIGGGSACMNGGADKDLDGGTATINISGNPIIRTGSIGGGETKAGLGQIGSADITISGGDIQAQFVMASGAKKTPTFTMSGGTIRNSYVDDEEYLHIQKLGGAVYLEDGTFTMTGGTIKNCSAVQGGAVYIARKSTEPMGEGKFNFKMEGGEIHSCFATGSEIDGDEYLGHGGAVCLNGGQVQMTGGKIWNNYSENGDGGAVYISNGNFFMEGGSPAITGNSAQKGNGGGVFVASSGSNVEVDLLKGEITGNSANNHGGGVCVDMGDTQYEAHVTVGKEGQGITKENANPKITGNMSMLSGGGLYVRGANANITINSGMIDENDVSAYVKNENVANEQGGVTLNAGLVTHVVVTFKGNSNKDDITGVTEYTQNIVTNTNSKLVGNKFVRSGYTFAGWNTRADGKGTDYDDEHIMNISENMTLYAKWVHQ